MAVQLGAEIEGRLWAKVLQNVEPGNLKANANIIAQFIAPWCELMHAANENESHSDL